MSLSVVITSAPIHGHVTPLLAVARHLTARGDRVRFLTGARFADRVEATGATHLPLPPDADFDDRIDLNSVHPERASMRGTRAIAFDVEHYFVRPGRGQYRALVAAHSEEAADVIVADPVSMGVAHLVDQAGRPPVVVAGIIPLLLRSADTAPYGMGLTPAPVLNRLRNRVLNKLASRVTRQPHAVADSDHRDLLGRALPFHVMDWFEHAEAFAQFTVAEFEYPRSDTPLPLHFLGPLGASGSTAALPEWWPDLDDGRPVVHVTQGTIANDDLTQLAGPTMEALADEDVLVVVSTGGRPLDGLGLLPANARAAGYLPYDELLPRTAAFVTNGGYGGVHYALRYGVPIVVTGGQEDKPEVGARVAWSGVGYRFKQERPTPDELRKAIREVLTTDSYQANAQRLAQSMTASPGMSGFAALLDDVVTRHRETSVV